jgi:N-acylglucosamine 2-epimerase
VFITKEVETTMEGLPSQFERIKSDVMKELYENVLPFWLNFSPDHTNGGFFACLDEGGEIYDDRKFMWLNGRQIWMFSRVCNDIADEDMLIRSNGKMSSTQIIQQAELAANFAIAHAIREDGLVYFSLAANGEPYHFERKIFAACFVCTGLAALSRHPVERAAEYSRVALELLHSIIRLAHDSSPLGRPRCSGAPAVSPMNVPMILLNVIDEFRTAGVIKSVADATSGINYEHEEAWCIEEILKHVIPDKRIVLENVGVDGSVINSYDGRHMNPGHAIEAGWFVLAYAQRVGREDLKETAKNMIEWSFEKGWDIEHGGLFYFLDSEGYSPPYLEWNMKLWWPHTEALIAYSMLYAETKEQHYWDRFITIYDYTISHFSDAAGGGEWYGYLDVTGKPTHRFKGGPYKGCFHVPRSLHFVEKILKSIEESVALATA